MTALKRLFSTALLASTLVFGQFTTLPGGSTGNGSIASTTSVIKGDGAGAGVAATAGTDFSKPNTTETTSGDRTFTGAVDASGATATTPAKVGTSLPGTCSVGQEYFKSDATAGSNKYLCTSSNTWTQQTGGTSGGVSTIEGYNIAGSTASLDGFVIAELTGDNTYTGINNFSNATRFAPKGGTTAPATCTVGDTFFDTDATAGQNWLGCTATDTWTTLGASSASTSVTVVDGPAWWPFGFPNRTAAGTATAWGSGTTRYYPFVVGAPKVTFQHYAFNITTANSSGAGLGVAFAIFDSSCNKVSGSDANTTDLTTGVKRASLASAIDLTPGSYYLASAGESATVILSVHDPSNTLAIANSGTVPQFFTGSNAVSGTGATLALPASCGTRTGNTGTGMFPIAMAFMR